MNFVACEKNSLAVDFIEVCMPRFVNFIEV